MAWQEDEDEMQQEEAKAMNSAAEDEPDYFSAF